jgi:hypothetical protein
MSTGLTHSGKHQSPVVSPLLSVPEACQYLKLGQSTLYERFDQFDVVRLGRRKFITRDSADRYIAAHTSKARKGSCARYEAQAGAP